MSNMLQGKRIGNCSLDLSGSKVMKFSPQPVHKLELLYHLEGSRKHTTVGAGAKTSTGTALRCRSNRTIPTDPA